MLILRRISGEICVERNINQVLFNKYKLKSKNAVHVQPITSRASKSSLFTLMPC